MECPGCGYENSEQAKFCGDCAQSLAAPKVCDACGTENPPRQKFCNECANPLSPAPAASAADEIERSPREYTPRHLAERILNSRSALEGERKRVTVLFADVRDSTAMASEIDPEAWHVILNRFFEIIKERHPPPFYGGGTGRVYYGTQVETEPPTFVLFVNKTKYFGRNYLRFLNNRLREAFPFDGTQIRIKLIEKKGRDLQP